MLKLDLYRRTNAPGTRRTLLFPGVVLPLLLLLPSKLRAELHFEQTTVHLGEVRGGVPLAHNFAFVHTGSEPIAIEQTRAGCGCVVPRLGKKLIVPGEKGVIPIEVNTLGQAAGAQRWYVQVYYREGNMQKTVALQLLAQVVTEVTIQPANLKVHISGPFQQSLRLVDLRPQPLHVTAVRCSSSHLQAVFQPGRRKDSQWEIPLELKIAAGLPDGQHEEIVSVYTDDPVYRHLKIPVTIHKRSARALSAVPAEIQLSAAADQPIPSRLVLIRASADEPVVIAEITAADPAIQCRWAAGPGPLATVRVQVDRTRLRGSQLQSVIRIRISAPQADVLTIPVYCQVER